MDRRSFLRVAGLGSACCAAALLAGVNAAEHAHPHWSYEGETGPNHWADLSSDFKTCQLGLQQTPIDLSSAMQRGTASIGFAYGPQPLRIVNNGHTIQADVEPGNSISIAGETYHLVQFHFHHPSEHLLDGKAFDMEAHFVHKAASGALAVVGVFIKAGGHNAGLQPIFDQMPASAGTQIEAAGRFDPAAFFPAERGYYRYMGSLTTPPCSEGLVWTVFHDPIEASPEQIRQFAALFPNNARPIQSKNDRLLIQTGAP